MWLKQDALGCLSEISFRIADEATRPAVRVNPQRHIDPHSHRASDAGSHRHDAFLSHFYAPFRVGLVPLRSGDLVGKGQPVSPVPHAEQHLVGGMPVPLRRYAARGKAGNRWPPYLTPLLRDLAPVAFSKTQSDTLGASRGVRTPEGRSIIH